MQLPHNSNPGLIVSKDETRYGISLVRVEDSYAIATDGRRMIVQQIRPENEHEKGVFHLHPETTQTLYKETNKYGYGHTGFEVSPETVCLTPYLDHGPKLTWKAPDDPSFPEWAKVIPEPSEKRIRIGLNPSLLFELSRAMDGAKPDAVFLDFDPEDLTRAMIVTGNHHDVFGILMPVRKDARVPNSASDIETNSAWKFAQERRSEMDIPKGWLPIRTAPKNCVHIRVIEWDGFIHDDAHWASDLSGEEQPPFSGWFFPVEHGYREIKNPMGWQAITSSSSETPAPQSDV